MNILQVFNSNRVIIENTQPLRVTLGLNVARLRTEQGLPKKTFSLMCGISRPLLDRIENGDSDVRLSYVQRLADGLCVDPLLLLQEQEQDSTMRA